MNMNQGELRHLADHLGHDLNIHVNHYAMQSELIERSKVARVLTAVFNGQLSKQTKPTELADINVDDSALMQFGELSVSPRGRVFSAIELNVAVSDSAAFHVSVFHVLHQIRQSTTVITFCLHCRRDT
jgi:hypothetical protein